MNRLLKLAPLIVVAIFLAGCDENKDGSLKSTYSSCKITSSAALLRSDRDHDLSQCWNAPGSGFSAQGDALQWCRRQVNSYMSGRYLVGHSVEFTVESTFCPR